MPRIHFLISALWFRERDHPPHSRGCCTKRQSKQMINVFIRTRWLKSSVKSSCIFTVVQGCLFIVSCGVCCTVREQISFSLLSIFWSIGTEVAFALPLSSWETYGISSWFITSYPPEYPSIALVEAKNSNLQSCIVLASEIPLERLPFIFRCSNVCKWPERPRVVLLMHVLLQICLSQLMLSSRSTFPSAWFDRDSSNRSCSSKVTSPVGQQRCERLSIADHLNSNLIESPFLLAIHNQPAYANDESDSMARKCKWQKQTPFGTSSLKPLSSSSTSACSLCWSLFHFGRD